MQLTGWKEMSCMERNEFNSSILVIIVAFLKNILMIMPSFCLSPCFLLSSVFLPPRSFLCLVLFPDPLLSCPLVSLSFNTPILLCQQKQRCPVLEEQLVDLVVYAMERSESEEHFDADVGGTSQLLWQHLSSQLIFFVLFQFASFPHMVLSLHQKVYFQSNYDKGDDI